MTSSKDVLLFHRVKQLLHRCCGRLRFLVHVDKRLLNVVGMDLAYSIHVGRVLFDVDKEQCSSSAKLE